MRRGAWHQFGDKSQKLALEQLKNGAGVGVVLSPRDLARKNAVKYSEKYRELNADVIIDQQFYIPHFLNNNLQSYPLSEFRAAVTTLHKIGDKDLSKLASSLEADSNELRASAVIAPAVTYEAGRPDIVDINAKLFDVARSVGNKLGIPVYATVALGRSVTSAQSTTSAMLSDVTGLEADGWYYAYEFESERIPSSKQDVYRCSSAGLMLACTGKPVMHAYAGPMSLLSLAFGAQAAAIGHSQNLWRFAPERWEPPAGQGGGGDAPPRFFSRKLWGTIIQPDEIIRLSTALRAEALTHTAFSDPIKANLAAPWSRWQANKHLVNIIVDTIASIASNATARSAAESAIAILEGAVDLHSRIQSTGMILGDSAASYQSAWLDSLKQLLSDNDSDLNYLEMLSS